MSHPKVARRIEGADFDYDRTRFCMPARNGVACYRGGYSGAEWKGKLEGFAQSQEEAQRFLQGMYVELQSA
jgi:hypothetical protein